MARPKRGAFAAAVRFGTSGWRGVLGEEVSFPRLRALAWACARWLAEQDRGSRVVVGYDTRFASEPMARAVAAVLAREGLAPQLSASWIPTPVLCRALLARRAVGGLMLTASHNPPEYHGLKVFSASGGCILDADARRIERLVLQAPDLDPGELERTPLTRADFVPEYSRALLCELDGDLLRSARLTVLYDAMHGAGAEVLTAVLRSAGVRVRVRRGERDPDFGGEAPDPTPEGLAGLARAVRAMPERRRIGLATDGDADRFGAVDADGRSISETEGVALLVDHLARSGRVSRGVAISSVTGSLVAKVAADRGLPVERCPIGFKHLTAALCEGRADVAGDESGGFALARIGRDKDGILAGCLLAEIAASAPGGLRGRLRELVDRFGPSACGRRAVRASAERLAGLARIASSPPAQVGASRVRAASVGAGVRLEFDDGFVLWRASGTEPVLRIYAEAAGPRRLVQRLEHSVALLEVAASGPGLGGQTSRETKRKANRQTKRPARSLGGRGGLR